MFQCTSLADDLMADHQRIMQYSLKPKWMTSTQQGSTTRRCLLSFLAHETSWQSLQVVECATQVGFMAKGVMYALIGGLCCQKVSKQAMRATNKLVSEHW